MEEKHVHVLFVVLTILLAISVSSVAGIDGGACYKKCQRECKGDPDYGACMAGCTFGCGRRTSTHVSEPSYFCNLGCSLQKCATIDADDENQLGRCLDECSTVHCKA
ncbi:UNVERIFIED_CONTAM: hypothetical protein Slati_3358900 [Sesamum latifolium]|uniref:Thionin-like protein n=1 Tax=Sesamum latifolium TaxID=2727402 RepID=A0AAW2UD58_9LAMI